MFSMSLLLPSCPRYTSTAEKGISRRISLLPWRKQTSELCRTDMSGNGPDCQAVTLDT
jgi:hypothetical protein